MIISVSYYVYYIYPWMSGSSPNLQPCSVGRTSLSEVVWLPRRRFFGGKPSWMGKFRKWWLNGDESHLMVFLKMLRIPTKSFIILRERIVIDQWFLRDPIFRPRIFGYPWIFQLRFFFSEGKFEKIEKWRTIGVMRICFDIRWRWREVVHSKMIQDVWISLILLGSCLTLYVLFLSAFKSCVRSTIFFWWTLHCSFPLPIQSNCVVDSVLYIYIIIYII